MFMNIFLLLPLNLIKKIPDRDLIKIGLKAIKTNQDSLVSVFFGYLIKQKDQIK